MILKKGGELAVSNRRPGDVKQGLGRERARREVMEWRAVHNTTEREAIHMSESMLKTIIRGALRSVGFNGCQASIYYRGGRATVCLNNGLTGIYDVKRGCFVDWEGGF